MNLKLFVIIWNVIKKSPKKNIEKLIKIESKNDFKMLNVQKTIKKIH